VLARRKDFFALHGVRLEITDDAIDTLVSKAVAQGTGARALRLVIDQMLRGVEHHLPEMAALGVNALIYDQGAVLGVSAPIKHMGTLSNSSQLIEVRQHAAYAKHIGGKTRISQLMT
jgi:ATP-dependent protease Clp ATPase subunit